MNRILTQIYLSGQRTPGERLTISISNDAGGSVSQEPVPTKCQA